MVQITLTDEQARSVREAMQETVELCDASGQVVAQIPPMYNKEFVAELKRKARSKGPWYTSDQVHARLQALQEEWDRVGGFDKEYMREFLKRLNEADPPRDGPTGPGE